MNPAVAGGMCGGCLRADVGGDPPRELGSTKEGEQCASGSFVTMKLGRCGLGSSVLGALCFTAKEFGDSNIVVGDNFGFWDFWDACVACVSSIFFGVCDNVGFWDICDFCGACVACVSNIAFGDCDNVGF